MSGNRRIADDRSVAQKLFAILDAFDDRDATVGPPRTSAVQPGATVTLTLTQIARHANLPVSTTHRLLEDWTRWGGIVRTNDGAYELGTRLWRLGTRAPTVRRLNTVARPYLEDLFDVTRQHVHLAVLDGDRALYLEHVTGHDSITVISDVGSRLPLHATGVGLVLLAFAPAELLGQIVDAEPKRFLLNTMTSESMLRPRLAQIRAEDLAVSVNELTEDSFSAAAPIRDHTNDVVAAVSVVAHASQATDPQFAIAVRVAARGISRALGWETRRLTFH